MLTAWDAKVHCDDREHVSACIHGVWSLMPLCATHLHRHGRCRRPSCHPAAVRRALRWPCSRGAARARQRRPTSWRCVSLLQSPFFLHVISIWVRYKLMLHSEQPCVPGASLILGMSRTSSRTARQSRGRLHRRSSRTTYCRASHSCPRTPSRRKTRCRGYVCGAVRDGNWRLQHLAIVV